MVTEAELKFFEFVYNRQEIWHKRSVLGMSKPWTTDPAMSQYRFCNCFRELDKGSKFMTKTILMNDELSFENKFFNIVAYRFFNHLNSFSTTHFQGLIDYRTFEFMYWEEQFDIQNEAKTQLFHKAYNVCGHFPHKNHRRDKKHVQVLLSLEWLSEKLIADSSFFDSVVKASSAKDSWTAIQLIPMVGPFLGYEIFSDLSYYKEYPWTDDDYVYIGPGALPGLRMIYGEDMKRKEGEERCQHLRDIQTEAFEELYQKTRKKWTDVAYRDSFVPYPTLSLGNVEQSLCEYRKWTNITQSILGNLRCAKRHF